MSKFVYHETYTVEANWGMHHDPKWVEVYSGTDRGKAIDKANYWDLRCDVRHDLDKPMDWRSVIDRKFDALEAHIMAGGFG
jgi:hypothetical protein